MRLEFQSEDNFCVYVNNLYFKDIDWDDREAIAKNMKRFVLKLNQNYRLALKGFYRVTVYVHKKIGTFLEVEKIDDLEFSVSTIDFRIVIYLEQPFFLEFESADYLPEDSRPYFLQGHYYLDAADVDDRDFLQLLEMSTVIYGEEVDFIIKKGRLLNMLP